jgi:hypothetical protein
MEDHTRTIPIVHFGMPVTVSVRTDRYAYGGGLAVQLDCEDGEPYATLSVNAPGMPLADEFVFKTYSENEGLLEAMHLAGVVVLTGRATCLGPVCRLAAPVKAGTR